MKRKTLLSLVLIGGLLAMQTPAMAARQFVDNGLTFHEAYYPSESSLSPSATLNQPPTIRIDGKYLITDVDPVMMNGTTLLPLRATGEALNARVDWDQATRTATATKDGRVVKFTLGSKYYTVNGKQFVANMAPTALSGRTLLPLRAFAEAFNAKVDWVSKLYGIEIDTDAPNAPSAGIPAGTNSDGEKFIKKYYVASSSSDAYVGSYKKTTSFNGTQIDTYLFVSPYKEGYHVVEVVIEDSPYYNTNVISVERDEAVYFYDNVEQVEALLVHCNQIPTYYCGPGRGYASENLTMYSFIYGDFYQLGHIELPSEQFIQNTDFDPFVKF